MSVPLSTAQNTHEKPRLLRKEGMTPRGIFTLFGAEFETPGCVQGGDEVLRFRSSHRPYQRISSKCTTFRGRKSRR